MVIPFVYDGLENFNLLSGDRGPVKPAYKFLSFSRKHAPANDFDPPKATLIVFSPKIWFNKHGLNLDVRSEM
jgi:hypothetical protein